MKFKYFCYGAVTILLFYCQLFSMQFQSKICTFARKNSLSNSAGNDLLSLLREATTVPLIPKDYRRMVERVSGRSSGNAALLETTINLSSQHWSLANIPPVHCRYVLAITNPNCYRTVIMLIGVMILCKS